MTWTKIDLNQNDNPYSSSLPEVSYGIHNVKIDSVKSEKDGVQIVSKSGEPMTRIAMKVIGGDSDGAFLFEHIFPDSNTPNLVRLTQSKLFDIGKSAGLTEITGPDSIIGALLKVKVEQDKKNPQYNKLSYVGMDTPINSPAPVQPSRPSLLAQAEEDDIPFQP